MKKWTALAERRKLAAEEEETTMFGGGKSIVLLVVVSTASTATLGFAPAVTTRRRLLQSSLLVRGGTVSPTTTLETSNETFQRSLLAAQLANKRAHSSKDVVVSKNNGKEDGTDRNPVNIGWDTHSPVVRGLIFVLIITLSATHHTSVFLIIRRSSIATTFVKKTLPILLTNRRRHQTHSSDRAMDPMGTIRCVPNSKK